MDTWTLHRLIEAGKKHNLESVVRKMLKANEIEHKRINVRALLVRQGVSPENIERLLSTPYRGEIRVPPAHQRPDAVERKELKRRMRGRRR